MTTSTTWQREQLALIERTKKFTKERCIISGYIGQYTETDIPSVIQHLCLLFFVQLHEILSFSRLYCSAKGFKFTDNDKRLLKINDDNSFILADTVAVSKGIHCYRIKSTNICNGWIFYGISQRRMFVPLSYRSLFGIAVNGKSNHAKYFPDARYQAFGYLHNDANTESFNKTECQIDMLLDIDSKMLKLCVVQKDANINDSKIVMMSHPSFDKYSWLPHFNIKHQGIQLRVAKIPPQWFGKPKDIFE